MATKLGVCITTKEMYGEGKPEKEGEDPWECRVFRGELVVEIPEKDWLFNKEGKPLNYQLLSSPDIVKIHAELTDISPLQRDELPYLLAVQPPGVRFQEYLREDRKKEIMALKVGDTVMFKLDQGHNVASNIIRGKIHYIGPVEESDGLFFGIEITEDKYHGRGTTNGRPHFKCGVNNAVYVTMDKIMQKSAYPSKGIPPKSPVISTQPKVNKSRQKHTSALSDHAKSHSGETITKAKDFVVEKVSQTIQGGTDVDPKPTEYKFNRGNRVVLQSIKERPITGIVRWVGPMRLSREPGSPQVIAVGIETDEKIKVKEEFPDLSLDITGTHGQNLFTISTDHSRVYLPEQMVLHVDEYELQQQKQNENELETKLAKEYGLSVEEYHAQKDLLDEANKSIITNVAKRIGHDKNLDRMSPNPPLADRNEEYLIAGVRVPVGGDYRQMEESAYLVKSGQPVNSKRVELERQALNEYKEQRDQTIQHESKESLVAGGNHRETEDSVYLLQIGQPISDGRIEEERKCLNKFKGQQREHHHHEDYQVIETQIEQTENLGNRASVGSRVYLDTQHGDPIHGVVKWIGTLPGIPGLIAGVELDNPLPGCTDGSWQGMRLFNCPPGKGFFCPITALRLETKHIDPGPMPTVTRIDLENEKESQSEQLPKPVPTNDSKLVQTLREQLKQQDREFENEKTKLQETNVQLKTSIANLQSKNKLLEKDKQDLEVALKTQKYNFEEQIQQVDGENQKLEKEKQNLQREVTDLQASQTQLQRDKDQFESELQGQVARLTVENMRLKGQVKQLEENSVADINYWEVSHVQVKSNKIILGEGGWGKVQVGLLQGQKVALKMLHSEIVSPYYNQLVCREISMMAKVRHPNLLLFIAAVLDHPSGSPIIITELLDTSLRKAYKDGMLPNNQIKLCLLRDVAAALNYLHRHKDQIIHRDVSSANVLLESKGHNNWKAKLSDFGSANLVQFSMTTGPGAQVYAAPEVPQTQMPKMDVYSYGILLCEVLTNQFPFRQTFPSMLQSLASNWSLMYQVIVSCTKSSPADRPDMEHVLQTFYDKFSSILMTELNDFTDI